MRVIAGSARSLQLKTVEGLDVRPTTDRIKETLFNMLAPYVPDSRFLDLFAGSGAIGIEAVSRGAAEAVFVDQNRASVKCINENLVHTKFTENTRVIQNDVLSAISILDREKKAFDVIFMDPPYNKELEREALEKLVATSLVTSSTLIVVEASMETDFDYLEDMGYELIKNKEYKSNKHLFIRKAEN